MFSSDIKITTVANKDNNRSNQQHYHNSQYQHQYRYRNNSTIQTPNFREIQLQQQQQQKQQQSSSHHHQKHKQKKTVAAGNTNQDLKSNFDLNLNKNHCHINSSRRKINSNNNNNNNNNYNYKKQQQQQIQQQQQKQLLNNNNKAVKNQNINNLNECTKTKKIFVSGTSSSNSVVACKEITDTSTQNISTKNPMKNASNNTVNVKNSNSSQKIPSSSTQSKIDLSNDKKDVLKADKQPLTNNSANTNDYVITNKNCDKCDEEILLKIKSTEESNLLPSNKSTTSPTVFSPTGKNNSRHSKPSAVSYSIDRLYSLGGYNYGIYNGPIQAISPRKTNYHYYDLTNGYHQKFSENSHNVRVAGGNTGGGNRHKYVYKDLNYDMPLNTQSIRSYNHFIYQQVHHVYHHHHHHNMNQYNTTPPGAIPVHYPPYNHHMYLNNRSSYNKRSWNWNYNNNNSDRRTYTNSNQNRRGNFHQNNKNNIHQSGTTYEYGDLSAKTNYQNNSNVKLVSDETIETRDQYSIRSSRSPTPTNPKSESPWYYDSSTSSQNCQPRISVTPPSTSSSSDNAAWSNNDGSDGLPSSTSLSVDTPIGNGSLNGYESDSSHSSYRYDDFDFAVEDGQKPQDNTIQGDSSSYLHNCQTPSEVTSLINFPTYSSDDSCLNAQAHYYSSQQNLTFWNSNCDVMHTNAAATGTALNNPYGSSQTIYSQSIINGNSSSDISINNHYIGGILTDATLTLPRRGCLQNRLHRGRRQNYQNFRGCGGQQNISAPTDRYLMKAHLIEIKKTPDTLLNNSKWDKLSNDIWTKFILSQQREETYRKKISLWSRLYVTIKTRFPKYGLYLVGSTISGFGADTSDVDMCLVARPTGINPDPRIEALYNLSDLRAYLSIMGSFEQFNLIEAKVPILRFKDSKDMLEVDLNFNNSVGIRNTQLLYWYSKLDWRLRPLVLVVKLWAQFHDINNAKNMTISSYSLVLMVIHFLQCGVYPAVLPCMHKMYPDKIQELMNPNEFSLVDMTEDIATYETQNRQTLGELFLGFLEYYSRFDYSKFAISIRLGKTVLIDQIRQAKGFKNDIHQWKELCIEEPFDYSNTARSVYDCETFERVKAVFINSRNKLQETLELNSIFLPFIPNTISKSPTTLVVSADEFHSNQIQQQLIKNEAEENDDVNDENSNKISSLNIIDALQDENITN